MNLQDIKQVYFIGIGGIGMSAIARYFNHRGVKVFGYDRTQTVLTQRLEEEGLQIHYEEDLNQIPEGIDLVIYTPAVPDTHKELQYFRKHEFPIKKRAEVLGIISRAMKTAAVAGTHGKTTTSTILAHLMREGGLDNSAFLGGIAQNYGSNLVVGHGAWVAVEADEYDRSFLHLSPDIAIINSMDADHLDIYGDHETMVETGFRAFVRQIKPGGVLLLHHTLTNYFNEGFEFETFGIEKGDHQAQNIRVEDGYFVFDYWSEDTVLKDLKFTLPGDHNVLNATAAIATALRAGASKDGIREGLQNFKGIKRRFEWVLRKENISFIDDYAHHPTELNAAIHAAKQLFPGKRITGVFQPHLYSRTQDFASGFAASLDRLDEAILLDIYPARELPIEGVTSAIIFDQMKSNSKKIIEKKDLLETLKLRNIEVLLTLGAGDIDKLVEPIKNYLEETA